MGRQVNRHARPVDGRSPSPDLRVLTFDGESALEAEETAEAVAAVEAAVEQLRAALARLRALHRAERREASMPELLTVAEVGDRLRIGRTAAYQLVARGELQTIRIGRVVRVPVDSLTRYLAAHATSDPTRTA